MSGFGHYESAFYANSKPILLLIKSKKRFFNFQQAPGQTDLPRTIYRTFVLLKDVNFQGKIEKKIGWQKKTGKKSAFDFIKSAFRFV